jgi:hypothetical protein
MSEGDYIRENDQGLHTVVDYASERFLNLDRRTGLVGAQCQIQLVGGFLTLPVLSFFIAVFWIVQDRNAGQRWQKLL